jgi:NTP pyrophosphatase (non-canonical NTP hydrolase)
MKKELFDLIKELSNRDPKTLIEKTLKTTEELGELAKAVLPYENTPQNTHKFSDKQKILEEVADTILGAISVGYNLGMDTEQIEAMLWKKAEYWASLQAKERKNPFPLPFELHVTIDPNSNLEKFKYVCSQIGVKAILLDLINEKGETVQDEVMTSSKFFGNNQQVYDELTRISNELERSDFKVVRRKIESTPWHPAAPSKNLGNQKMHKNGYFESHTDVLVKVDQFEVLNSLAKEHKAVISHNLNKTLPDGSKKMILTIRSYKGFYEEFKVLSRSLQNDLMDKGFEPEADLIEFALYDTAIGHDNAWIKSE